MDLHFLQIEPSDVERSAIDSLLGPPGTGWDGGARRPVDRHLARGGAAARRRRHLLLPALRAVQSAVGWISEGALSYIAQRLTVPPAEVYGVASFYALLATEPRPARVAHVCDDIACRAAGVAASIAALEAAIGPEGTNGSGFSWFRSPCLGRCESGSAAFVQVSGGPDVELGPASHAAIESVLRGSDLASGGGPAPLPQAGDPSLRLLRRVGLADPTDIDDYRAHGGYAALRRALAIGPRAVIDEVTASQLKGRGGAAFPTGPKWEMVATNPRRPRYVVCNADESEPGTFKDRILMEGDPFAVIEAVTIAGFAVGAEHGYIYVRGEYPGAASRLSNAIDAARARRLLGHDLMSSGVAFDIEIRHGAGAYICGEETALFNSIEGFRGEPRNKPPYPTESGLFGMPTLVNNVETLVNVPEVLLGGADAYRAVGSAESTGTRLFCLSGHVARPGVYEVEFGATIRDLIALAGGMRGGSELGAVLLGGAAGTFVSSEQLDVPLTFEAVRSVGASLGSGAVMVFDTATDFNAIARRIAAFFRDESCGQCVPCRVGTVRQEEALQRIEAGRDVGARDRDAALIDEIGRVMRDASICGLGQTAANAVLSALDLGLLVAVPPGRHR